MDGKKSRYTYDSEPWNRPDSKPSRYAYDAGAGEAGVKRLPPKLVIGMVAAVVLVIAAAAAALVLWLNSKQPVTAEEFTAVLERHGFAVTAMDPDRTGGLEYFQTVLGSTDAETYQIVYCHMADGGAAWQVFANTKAAVENEKGPVSGCVNINMGRFGSYSQTSGGLYSCVSYIDDTVISIRAEESRKGEMKEILKELGY